MAWIILKSIKMESGKYYNPMSEFKFRGSNVVSNEELVNSTVSRFFGY